MMEDVETYLIMQLEELQKSYMRDAKPFIDHLVKLRAMKPPLPIFLSREAALSMDLRAITPDRGFAGLPEKYQPK